MWIKRFCYSSVLLTRHFAGRMSDKKNLQYHVVPRYCIQFAASQSTRQVGCARLDWWWRRQLFRFNGFLHCPDFLNLALDMGRCRQDWNSWLNYFGQKRFLVAVPPGVWPFACSLPNNPALFDRALCHPLCHCANTSPPMGFQCHYWTAALWTTSPSMVSSSMG